MSSNTATDVGYTTAIFQSFEVYIEGIQVPFESITISSGGGLPNAVISIPPTQSLMDIARFYQPKVHIFFEDQNDKRRGVSKKEYMKLIFHGNIIATDYSKYTSPSGGGISIQFRCRHRNAAISDLLIDYTDWINNPMLIKEDGALAENHPNSLASIYEALTGITSEYDEKKIAAKGVESPDPRYLSKTLLLHYSKLMGIPGVMVNYWNQLKRAAYTKEITKYQDVFTKMYEPLVENGLHFFERLSGHSVIEKRVEDSRIMPCPTSEVKPKSPSLVPPATQMSVQAAFQLSLTMGVLQNYMQRAGDKADFFSLMEGALVSMDYSIVTLTSPAETPMHTEDLCRISLEQSKSTEKTSAVETIVRPNIPFYFSPSCNILYPKMYSGISVQYDELSVPTRTMLINQEGVASTSDLGTRFRAPNSIREAIIAKLPETLGKNLESTTGYSHGAVGKYEQGTGVRSVSTTMPPWLGHLSQSMDEKVEQGNGSVVAPTGLDASVLADLKEGWEKRYPGKPHMNPWSEESTVPPHHKLLFAAAEYSISTKFSMSKSGSVSCPFNPYIIPGYPMDILDNSPSAPSFHALCTQVTHSITAGSVDTQVSFISAMTYTELANYYIPFISPALQAYLGLASNPTLTGVSLEAKNLADEFYYYTVGTKAIIPEMVYDFASGLLKPIDINEAGAIVASSAVTPLPDKYGVGDLNKNTSFAGNMALTYRPIESQASLEKRFNYKFISMTYANYNPTVVKYKNEVLDQAQKLEIGASQFLDYSTNFGEEIK